ncbi:hypothetical protein J5N97_021237 [Dioscorea zingiberensis]|uniref:Uncharacterized protein n=1 Tax=Dioscorea zingiberensis TaxID=325984 RepID=A0A9D5HEG4_9LILI|nr:hypothetical protein J5N97_021237 [Dioscorea zingiberensis]
MPLVAMIHAQAINFSCSSLVSVQIFLVHMMFGDLLNCGSFEDALQPLDDMSDRDDDTSETSLGHFDVAIYPLEQVADPSVSREFRATPLHHVTGIGTIELLTFLLSDAGTPLSWVVGPGQQDIVKILLAHIANPHIAIGDGGATHVAADIGNKESVTCFLIAGGIFTLFTLYFGLGSLLSAFGYYQLKGCKGDSVGQQCTMPQDSREGLPDFHLEDKVNFEEGGNDAGLVS